MEKRLQEPPFGLRMAPTLKRLVKAKAKEANRSMNNEINHRLTKSYEAEERAQAQDSDGGQSLAG